MPGAGWTQPRQPENAAPTLDVHSSAAARERKASPPKDNTVPAEVLTEGDEDDAAAGNTGDEDAQPPAEGAVRAPSLDPVSCPVVPGASEGELKDGGHGGRSQHR
jgi:hypothetical protein